MTPSPTSAQELADLAQRIEDAMQYDLNIGVYPLRVVQFHYDEWDKIIAALRSRVLEIPEELVQLSEKATPGPWTPENPHQIPRKTTVCYLYFGKPLGPRPEVDGYSDCLSLASERGLQDAQFIAALVNWFRAAAKGAKP